MNWCFAIINGRLAEIFFEKKKGRPRLIAHAYVKASEYKTAKERRYIKEDTKRFRFTYRNKNYINQLTGRHELKGSFARR